MPNNGMKNYIYRIINSTKLKNPLYNGHAPNLNSILNKLLLAKTALKVSDFLQMQLGPDIEQVAFSIARKFNWQIEISGNSALNILGLSTQVPDTYLYLSNGVNRKYTINENIIIEFKKSTSKIK